MPVVVPLQPSFNSGKFSSRMRGRSDLASYAFACDEIQNYVPTIQGPLIKRSGTRFVSAGIFPSKKSRIIAFRASIAQAYILELSAGVMRFYRDGGAVLESTFAFGTDPTAADPVVVTTATHSYATGESVFLAGSAMTELNGRFFTITVLSSTTFELDDEDGVGRTTGSGGTSARHYQLKDGVSQNTIPWLESELDAIKVEQNGDLMYLVHPSHPQQELIRISDTSWTIKAFAADFPALSSINLTDTALSIDITTEGAGRVIFSDTAIFVAGDVGRVLAIGQPVEEINGEWKANFPRGRVVRDGTWTANDMIHYLGRVYEVQTSSTGTTGSSGPIHEEGILFDGGTEGDLLFWNWGWGIATITTVTDSTHVIVTVTVPFPKTVLTADNAETSLWSWGAWDSSNGFPRAVAFFEDRLWFGGTLEEPQTFWGSKSGKFGDFRITPADLDDTGVQFTLLADQLNGIEWMQGDSELIIGTTGGEYTADSGSPAEGISPSNVRVRRRSGYGTTSIVQPRSIDSSILFVRRNSDVYDLTFDFDTDRQVSVNLTQFSHNILQPGAREIVYQADPFRLVWISKTDGTLATLTFDKQAEVTAWADVVVGGEDAFVESIASIPHPDGDEDQVWLAIRRTINGETVRYIEYFEKAFDTDDVLEDAFFVESGATYDSTATTTITGLWHLEGETVVVLADGARVDDEVVADGEITLSVAASTVQIGLAMGSAFFQTVRWNAAPPGGGQGFETQGMIGRLSGIILRVDQQGDALEFGGDFDNMELWERRTPADLMDAPISLFSGDSPLLAFPGGWGRGKQIAVRHNEPTPSVILSIAGKLDTEVP